ncbi:MAG: flagellar biosynthesis anti-sigma factor FlgM [Thermoleophilia bacterium]|nr:flagellar biosynthesis anti-sigma factor FlgM [Thermoleophilia bacterium]
MSARYHRPDEESLVEISPDKNEAPQRYSPQAQSAAAGVPASRVRVIHELVQSGCYYVPASAVAEKMIEHLIARRRGVSRQHAAKMAQSAHEG